MEAVNSVTVVFSGARYYEPTSGRFLSADPLGQYSSPSLYDFATGDPVNGFDPTGLVNENLFAKGSPLFNGDVNFNISGVYTVGAHGSPTSIASPIVNQYSGNSTSISPAQLAQIIVHDPNYSAGKPVLLDSCNTGADTSDGSPNFAAQLSTDLQNLTNVATTVVAPNTPSYSPTDTTIGAYNSNPDKTANYQSPGSWNVFRNGSQLPFSLSNQNVNDLTTLVGNQTADPSTLNQQPAQQSSPPLDPTPSPNAPPSSGPKSFCPDQHN